MRSKNYVLSLLYDTEWVIIERARSPAKDARVQRPRNEANRQRNVLGRQRVLPTVNFAFKRNLRPTISKGGEREKFCDTRPSIAVCQLCFGWQWFFFWFLPILIGKTRGRFGHMTRDNGRAPRYTFLRATDRTLSYYYYCCCSLTCLVIALLIR